MNRSYQDCLRQKKQLIPEDTDLIRVIDGIGDGYPDLFVDRLGECILISTRDRRIPMALLDELRSLQNPVFHKRLERDQKEAPTQIAGPKLPLQFPVHEQGVLFRLDMEAGYSQGIFLDQREHRRLVRERCAPGMRILNTFAYTGAFSVYAALGGAQTTTLDLAQPCLDWAKENFRLNELNPEDHYFCKGDAIHWLERFVKQGRTFNGIILDPPTFSRDGKGRIFRVEDHYGQLVELASRCVEKPGWILCTSNCRKLSHEQFKAMVRRAVPEARLTQSPMPPDFNGEDYLKRLWVEFV